MNLDYFLPHLLVELPGVSDPLVKQVLLRSAIDFCQRSQAWQELALPITLIANQPTYTLSPPADAQIYLLLDVWLGRYQLRPLTIRRQQLDMAANSAQGTSLPTHFASTADRQALTLYPPPVQVMALPGLQVKVCYTPTPTATTLPNLLAERYLMAVCAGTKANLMAIPNQSFSNPALAGYYRQQFEDGVLAAKLEAVYDTSTGGQLSVAPRAFGF